MKHFLLLISVLASFSANAQWSTDPAVNIAISDTAFKALTPAALSDGKGGAFIFWSGPNGIIGQKFNANGSIQWDKKGLMVGIFGDPGVISSPYDPKAISDDSGGAIITYRTTSAQSIHASRIGADGTIIWDKQLSYDAGYRVNPVLTSDGAGGAIVTWDDSRNGLLNNDIYAQRVSATGEVMWNSTSNMVCGATGHQTNPGIASDGNGGAFITWPDSRKSVMRIYAQHINSLGERLWQADGMSICATNEPASVPKIVATAQGEAIISWSNGSSSGTWDIYGQKVDKDTVRWAANGVPICNAPLTQFNQVMVADGSGGAIVAWEDLRTSLSEQNIYAQDIDRGGIRQWALDGVPICTLPLLQSKLSITSDGFGGAIMAWQDYRLGTTYYDVFAQRVGGDGSAKWGDNGIAVCLAPKDQMSIAIAGDGKGGGIFAWADYRNSSRFIIYAQGVRENGTLGGTTSAAENPVADGFSLDQNYPNPGNLSTTISYRLSHSSFVKLTVYNTFGQQVSQLVNEKQTPGNHEVVFQSERLGSGTYFYRLQAGDFVATKKMMICP